VVSITQLQEVPRGSMILLVGPPGAGKSTFCHQITLNNLATNRPVIFVTTEYSPSDVTHLLRERGLGETPPGILNFVDAFHETVGLMTAGRPDTVDSSCGDLTSIEVAISKLQERIQDENILVVFDSLTSPYLLNGQRVIRFLRLSLAKFAAEGNSVFASMAEGCGKEEHLGAMMTTANGIIKMGIEDGSRVLTVVKHPLVEPTTIRVRMTARDTVLPLQTMDALLTRHYSEVTSRYEPSVRSEAGDFVNLFWRSLIFWSGMLWDPKRFPTMHYDLAKEITYQGANLIMKRHPWHIKLLWRFLPKKSLHWPGFFENRIFPIVEKPLEEERVGMLQYIPGDSKVDEHHTRISYSASCWSLENVGARLCYDEAAYLAGFMKFFDKERRDWNAVETTCVGEGSPYCEFKVAPGEQDELEDYLTSMDASKIERIGDRLTEHVKAFITDQKPLGERPKLGSGVHTHEFVYLVTLPALASERYQMAVRIAGATAGKRLGEHLMNVGLREEETIKRMIDLLEYCRVGNVSMDETIRIRQNCESFGIESEQPTCFFTTAFLNGLFTTVKGQHTKEVKCIAVGDPYCEWEFR